MRLRLRQTIWWDWELFWMILRALLATLIFALLAARMRPDFHDPDTRALAASRDHLFDFALWEMQTTADKTSMDLIGAAGYMNEHQQVLYVRRYLGLVAVIQALESRIEAVYIDPNISDPAAASAGLRAARDTLRGIQAQQQALAESIIQWQVASLLNEYGLGLGGVVFPPVEIRFTELPRLLVVSRRDRIERISSEALAHGMTVEAMQSIEDDLYQQGDSAVIVPLGGLAVYPAMLIETGYTPHVFEITAHEWTHHYLAFYPMGYNYGASPEMFTINETTASMVGKEIGWAVLHRYYPDLAGNPPDYAPLPPEPPTPPDQPPAFDFNAGMRETRVNVDAMLASGHIKEAEQYMERRRAIFVANGYDIRRLNQAYFSFFGSYADQPGATGADPIGPALRQLRYLSPNLLAFIERARSITSLDQLNAAVEAASP
jgi:hypothetical protein